METEIGDFVVRRKMKILLTLLAICMLMTFPASGDADGSSDLQISSDDNAGWSSTETVFADYGSGFDPDQFDLDNVDVSYDGKLFLNAFSYCPDPNELIVPVEAEVCCTFLYEGSGPASDFGWMLYNQVTDSSGNFKGWDYVRDNGLAQPVFNQIKDDNETGGCCAGGNGVFDENYGNENFPTANEEALAGYDDGSGVLFEADGDGQVTPKDMKKSLGSFAGGVELVFFLSVNQRYTSADADDVFFTKTAWNPDAYISSCVPGPGDEHWIDETNRVFYKEYKTGEMLTGETSSCRMESAWLTEPAFLRLVNHFEILPSGLHSVKIQKNVTGEFPHVIMVSSDRNQGQWLMGWEDLSGGGDADYNDLLFLITMKMSGEVSLKTKHAISPYNPDLFYKSATIEVFDNIPGSESGCGSSGEITYFISPDGGNKWIEITEWDVVMRSDENGNTYETVADWTPGTPEYTYRSASVDFQALGISGDKLIWKAEMKSEGGCAPGIINVKLNSSFFQSAILSHTSAAVQANVVYTGKYATPGGDWPADEQWLRGHLTATRIYDPAIPVNGDDTATSTHSLWDAGQRLASVNPSARKIYSPEIGGAGIVDADDPEIIAGLVGNGVQDEFTGKLNLPEGATLWPGSLFIADEEGREVFNDVHVKEMMAQSGRSETGGRINRSTGEFSITYSPSRVPRPGKRILAWYRYYNAFGDLREVSSRTITYEDLCLTGDDSCDFDEDGAVDENDADWLTNWVRGYKDGKHTAKTWLLGAIDHSTPAFCAPPGLPEWYDTLACEEKESYLRFREEQKERRSVLYAGAKDGMLHAFDAGAFRWGDNPKTPTVTERHGYFKWKGSTSGTADYGDGDELWAFIPADLLSRLKHNVAADDASVGVDGSPVIADVFVNDAWRTVLICGEGTGGESVFCLDVTEPETPRFMWEFIDADMFGTRSAPVIARVLTDNGSKWAAFFVSDTVATDCDSDEESDYCYPSVFVVDVADGSLIQRIFLDSEADGKNGIPAGPPAVLDMDGNGFADRFYLGTDKGFMYKVNMPDDGASFNEADDCIIAASNGNTVTTPNQPIYAAPAVVKKDGQATLFFGTGDSPFKSDSVSGAQYHFFAYTDQSDKMACGTVDLDWFITLPSGYKVFAPAAADDANVYLTTSTADTESLYDFSGTTYSDRSASSGQKRDTDSMTVSVVTYSVVTYPDSGNNTKIISRYDITLASSPGGIGNLYALSQKNEEYVNGTAVVIGDTVSLPVIADRHVYVNTIFNGLKSFGSGSYNNITGEGTLKNAIRILKMLAGDSSEIVTTDMDMSGDGKVGIEDVVYILRTISETQAPSQSGGAQEGAGANKDYYGDDASGTDLFGETNGF